MPTEEREKEGAREQERPHGHGPGLCQGSEAQNRGGLGESTQLEHWVALAAPLRPAP